MRTSEGRKSLRQPGTHRETVSTPLMARGSARCTLQQTSLAAASKPTSKAPTAIQPDLRYLVVFGFWHGACASAVQTRFVRKCSYGTIGRERIRSPASTAALAVDPGCGSHFLGSAGSLVLVFLYPLCAGKTSGQQVHGSHRAPGF